MNLNAQNLSAKIRTVIVDDEPLAREKIRMLLQREPEIEIIDECTNGQEAIATIKKEFPDLLFLDIQMPGADGFEVLRKVGINRVAAIVFVTAYDQHALRAFEFHALDYLLKPFAARRFREALQRAKEHLRREPNEQFNRQLLALLNDINRGLQHDARLMIKSGGRVVFLKTGQIDWIEAAGNYVLLHAGKDSHMLHETMNHIHANLDPRQFLRIHRSTIVNVECIKELQPLFYGDYQVILKDGTKLTLSRKYSHQITQLFQLPM